MVKAGAKPVVNTALRPLAGQLVSDLGWVQTINKAFVREPDDTGERHCPKCGSLGVPVARETLAAQLSPAAMQQISESGFFCPFGRCEVAYFDLFERVVGVELLLKPVYPKDPDAPLCGCFGLSEDEIRADVNEGGVRRVRELLAKSKTAAAHCQTAAASGHCCMPEVQRLFMKLRGEKA